MYAGLTIAVFPWRHLVFFFEQAVKIRQIIESCALRDRQNAVILRKQKSGGNGEPVAVQITGERCVQMLLKEFHKM